MSKLEFKAEDFDHIEWHLRNMGQPQGAARDAQARFEKWLSEQPVVYGKWSDTESQIGFIPEKHNRCVHRARLVCIEEIKKECEHERDFGNGYIVHRTHFEANCKHCGIKLKATWGPA